MRVYDSRPFDFQGLVSHDISKLLSSSQERKVQGKVFL